MKLKLAREELTSTPKTIDFNTILSDIENNTQKIYYFDKDNSHKTMLELVDNIQNLGRSIYFREIKYGLDDGDYTYEVHIL